MRDPGWKPTERDVPPSTTGAGCSTARWRWSPAAGTDRQSHRLRCSPHTARSVEIAEIDPDRAEGHRETIEARAARRGPHVVDVTDPADVERLAAAVLGEHGRHRRPGQQRRRLPAVGPLRGLDSRVVGGDVRHQPLPRLRRHPGLLRPDDRSRARARSSTSTRSRGMRGFPGRPGLRRHEGRRRPLHHQPGRRRRTLGIRVNGIGPDLTQSPQVDYLTGSEGHDHLWPSWAPVGRLGWPEDQARVALFLASDLSAYVTGHNIPVDGGTKAGGGWFWVPARVASPTGPCSEAPRSADGRRRPARPARPASSRPSDRFRHTVQLTHGSGQNVATRFSRSM